MAAGKRVLGGIVAVVVLAGVFGAGFLAATLGLGPTASPSSLADRERQFSERMTGVSLVGKFTLVGMGDRQPSEDREGREGARDRLRIRARGFRVSPGR